MIDPSIIIAIVSAVAAVCVAGITFLQHRAARASQTHTESIQTIIQELRASNADSKEQLAKLTERVKKLEAENDGLHGENRRLQGQVHDQAELIEDFVAHAAAQTAWVEAGANPPPPASTWRIRQELANRARQLTRQATHIKEK